MENNINIAEILKNKPKGTKLYSPICGAVELERVLADYHKKSIVVKELNSSNQHRFWHDGNFFRAGQCVLQPSENMADWSKFSWKKGDVLQNNDHNTQVIFDRFTSDTYEMIRCKYWLKVDNGNERFVKETNVFTKYYFKVNKELSQCYINEIENRLDGIFNRETLEIEPAQLKFKDGDIVSLEIRYIDSKDVIVETYIVHGDYNYGKELNFYAGCNNIGMIKYNSCVKPTNTSVRNVSIRYAIDSEKQQLFEVLAKKNKAWDAKKNQLMDLKPKSELKPFDKVLVRDNDTEPWAAAFFEREYKHKFFLLSGFCFDQCIPYKGNEHLLGTTKNVKG